MSRLRYNRKVAVDHLKSSCPQMAELIRKKGAFRLQVSKDGDLFTSLASSIVYQQLSGKAAATMLIIVSIILMFTMEALRRRGERLRGISPS